MKKWLLPFAMLPLLCSAAQVDVSYLSNATSMYYATCTAFASGSCSAWNDVNITSSNAYNGNVISLGDTFSAEFAYDTSSPLSGVSSDGTDGTYLTAIQTYSFRAPTFNVAADEFSSGDFRDVSVVNNGLSGWDSFFTERTFSDGDWFGIITTDLFDYSGRIYDDLSLPSSVNLSDFDSGLFELAFVNRTTGDQLQIAGKITALEGAISSVPEPQSVELMFATVPAAIFIWLRNKRRQGAHLSRAASRRLR